ncbi:lytic transglycosylase domain-containing protein [Roseomonas sp. SSH11]|uniref:Lytic transglycosylase domain-containing protein n=1 Tax=Pararoseomonas baculiformis TaxID=2820812 RepID=A0ABS4ADX9_9PROT|nr:lytic transglycosylase domain-containing protein [Pararoseomonas baculiformis]
MTMNQPGRLPALLLAAALAGCAGPAPQAAWDGRRGYGGTGDYGYDLTASRAEAFTYRAHAARSYAVPGPPSDPWGPHIREASARFGVPERWIRAIMRQESGGRLYDANGYPITSPVGAMGLMQVMPRTYDILRARHGLGDDPYEPRDNILAGAAYIREMHDRYGAPGFAAAYNAGPDRVDGFLSGSMILPDETIHYLASVTPRLGPEVVATGPWAEYAGGGYGTTAVAYGDDPSLRAFEGGGLVTPGAPTGWMR